MSNDYNAVVTQDGNLTYLVHPSLYGSNTTVSIEIAKLPGYHMRQDGSSLRFEDKGSPAKPEDYARDSSFGVTLDCEATQHHCLSLESLSMPGHFVTHEQEILTMKSGNSEAAKYRTIQGMCAL